MIAAAGPSALWYLTRGTGLVTLLLLTASVVLGVLQVLRWSPPGSPRFVVVTLHRAISLLVVVLLSVHVLTAVLDRFAPIRLVDAVLPFAGAYRPLWLGLGALAFDLLIALTVTSLLRRRLGLRAWRGVHWLAYACWPVALVHGWGTGSDTRTAWMLAITLGCAGAVLGAVAWRLASGWPEHARARAAPRSALHRRRRGRRWRSGSRSGRSPTAGRAARARRGRCWRRAVRAREPRPPGRRSRRPSRPACAARVRQGMSADGIGGRRPAHAADGRGRGRAAGARRGPAGARRRRDHGPQRGQPRAAHSARRVPGPDRRARRLVARGARRLRRAAMPCGCAST